MLQHCFYLDAYKAAEYGPREDRCSIARLREPGIPVDSAVTAAFAAQLFVGVTS